MSDATTRAFRHWLAQRQEDFRRRLTQTEPAADARSRLRVELAELEAITEAFDRMVPLP